MNGANANPQAQYQQAPQGAPQPQYQQAPQGAPQPQYQQVQYQPPQYQQAPQPQYRQPVINNTIQVPQIPDNYKPVSAWGYVGYNILFCIPLVGLILLIVFSFSDKNINRRNYARSFWCVLLLSLIIAIIIVILSVVFGFSLISAFG